MVARRMSFLVASALLAGACGSSSSAPDGGYTITISSMTFNPANLTVPPGATVTVHNNDSMTHTVTSQSSPAVYTPGAVNGVSFDTGSIAPSSSATFTIPSSAPHGTVVPYYCAIHQSLMGNQGQISVQ